MSVKKNIIANYGGNFIAVAVNFSLVPIYLKYLSDDEYGLIAFFATINSVFVILDMGLGLTINKEVAASIAKNENVKLRSEKIRSFELIYWLFAFTIGIILFLSSSLIADYWLNSQELSKEIITLIVTLMGLAMIFRWPISFYNNVLSGFQKMIPINTIRSFIIIINISITFVLFHFFDLDILGLFRFLILLYLMHTALLMTSTWNRNKFFLKSRFKIEHIKREKKFLVGIGFFSVIGTFFTLFDKVLVSKFFLTSELGYYSLVSSMALVLLQFVYPISSALFPKFVDNYAKNEIDKSFSIFRKGYQLIIILVLGISSCLLMFKKVILEIWTQDIEFVNNCIEFVFPLIVGTVFYTLHILVVSVYTSLGKTKSINLLFISLFLLYVLTISYAIYNSSLLSVAYSYCFINILLFICSMYLASRLLGVVKILNFLKKDVLIPLVLFVTISLLSQHVVIDFDNIVLNLLFLALSSIISILIYGLLSSYARSFIRSKLRLNEKY